MFSLSVVVPNYNRSALLLRSLASVIRQASGTNDIIVIDDGSSENLLGVYRLLEGFGVRVIRVPERRGGSHARNVGVEAATGTHVAFLNSDDVWLPGWFARLAAQAPTLEQEALLTGAMLYQWGEITRFEQPAWPPGQSPVDFIYRDGGRLQTSMLTLPREIAQAHPFRETLRVNQDSDFALRLHASGVGFRLDPEPGVIKDKSDNGVRLSFDPAIVERSYDWFRSVSADWSPKARSGYYLYDRAWRLLATGRRREVFACLLRANLPPVSLGATARTAAGALLGPAGYERLRTRYRRQAPKPETVASHDPALAWFRELDEASRRVAAVISEPAPGADVQTMMQDLLRPQAGPAHGRT